jgi:hypothetical protein
MLVSKVIGSANRKRRDAMAMHTAVGKGLDVHPVLETLTDQLQTGNAVRLQGYVGPAKDDRTLRLHASFEDLSEYIDVPQEAGQR